MDFSKKYDNPSPEDKANPISRLLYCADSTRIPYYDCSAFADAPMSTSSSQSPQMACSTPTNQTWPQQQINWMSWLFPLLKYGYSNDLELKDLYNTARSDLSEHLGNTLERNWEKELVRAKEKKQQPELLKAITSTFIKPYSVYGVELFFQSIVLKLTQPLVLAALIQYFDHSKTTSAEEGWLLAVGVILMALVNVIIMHHANLGQTRIGMQCRVATCSLIYRKLLRLNKASVAHTAAGQVVNLLSNDVARFDMVPAFLHYIWIMPIQTVVAGVIMYSSIGYAALAGILAITIQAVPLQGYLSHLQGKLRYKIANRTDRRVQLMNEITAGIQVIKMYAWEKPFEKMVIIARKLEIDTITITSYIRGFLVALMVFTERFTLFLTVITYVLLGNRLTGDKVFSMAQFFNTIQLYMAIFYPLAVSFYAEAKTSVKRIEDFLIQEEMIVAAEPNEEPETDNCGTIKINNGKASWIPNPIIDTLSNINLDIKPGSLCAVVGQVGAGKSSLLQLLLKELPLNGGQLEIVGKVSYASQEPWLFVSTVRNNILFGLPYTKSRYKNIVQVCALERDFELFPNGDRTLVGERGVSLSGGQRARINLARAVYRQADIYLFDDPLSAVDTHVGKHLFEECILKHLGDKTRILVTHQLQFLKHADQIVIINNGQIERVGTYSELADRELAHLQHENSPEETDKTVENKPRSRLMSLTSHTSTVDEDDENEPQETQELMEKGAISSSLYWSYFREGGSIIFLLFFVLMLILAQVACNASDIWVTYWTNEEESRYNINLLKNGNVSINNDTDKPIINGIADLIDNITTVLPNILNNATAESSDNYTKLEADTLTLDAPSQIINKTGSFNNATQHFLNDTDIDAPLHSQSTYIYIYTGLIVAAIILTTFRSFLFFKICMNASRGLHNTMFNNVLKATMRFFDTNPSGRILSRFSKDMGAVDEILPKALLDAVQIFMVMSGILAMVFIVTPWMIIPTVILAMLFFGVRKIYLASAQNIKRLEGITRAPAFSHVSASLSGLTTIRASGAQVMITKEFDIIQDQHTSSWFLFLATSEAFGFYLDIISIVFLVVLTFQFLIFDDGTTLSGDVGLVISQSLILTGMLQYGMRQTAEVASQMTSVERIMQYTRLDKEGPFESTPTKKPHRDWPQHGQITFKNLTLTYVPEEPPVLNNLNISIQAGEKVGIVGRTGAGKSSLIAALFRLAPTDGSITIDSVNTKDIGLNDLRSNVSIIPQEPVLFTASLRHNLDPLDKTDDKALWKSLEDVELKDVIDNLNQEVNEGGSNFSAGQRQLICLARAIIRNNKILVMDEATANVDPQTDALIQATIRRNFKDCTVLTIAHRLNTVMDSDKVLVMDAGRTVEFGHPHELLQKADGYFSSMLKETGKNMELKLRRIAEECYKVPSTTTIEQNNQNEIDHKKDN